MRFKQIFIFLILFFVGGIACNLYAKNTSIILFNDFNEADSLQPSLILPNAFQPNGISSQITIFKPVYKYVVGYNMVIYNRWGMLIFESNNPEFGWNGTYKGKMCPVDAYVYVVTYYPMPPKGRKGEKIVQRGIVTLLE